MTITNVLFRLMLVTALVFSVVACENNNAEEAGEKIDEVVATFARSTKYGAIVSGQTSVKHPEIAAFEKHLPEIAEVFEAASPAFNTKKEKQAIGKVYPLCTNISIDYGVMEKADNVYVMPSSFGWSDLGTWNSAYENMEKDYLGNAVASDNVIVIDATKCMVNSPKDKLVVLQGLDDFIVVDTKDVLLICSRDKEQSIKEYVAEVKRNKGDKYI